MSDSLSETVASLILNFDSALSKMFACLVLLSMCVRVAELKYRGHHPDSELRVVDSLHGITSIQAYTYFVRYSQEDGRPIKSLVPLIFFENRFVVD